MSATQGIFVFIPFSFARWTAEHTLSGIVGQKGAQGQAAVLERDAGAGNHHRLKTLYQSDWMIGLAGRLVVPDSYG